ncbi:MAG: hypothetical protein M1586_00705 [Patescibacteria group bacterium]|nr:hypothetical protein [Patescibacteria group bacterium]MCL5261805.1 hypothetical protein [Patescibacteria group bacterium]
MLASEKIGQILRTPADVLRRADSALTAVSGKVGVLDKIVEDNESTIRTRLDALGLGRNVYASEVYDSLISRIESDDHKLFDALGDPSLKSAVDWQKVLDAAKQAAGSPRGFFLKKEKAKELILNQPPENVMNVLGYASASEMLANENIFEVFAALRFVEGNDWLNKVFFKQYECLTAADFEERPVEAIALPDRWLKPSEGFINKKYHNISHLKEMGLVFSLPLHLLISGELLRNFSLILHYFNEINFYSAIFKDYAADADFAGKMIVLLKGETAESRSAFQGGNWLILPRYLAKDDENDTRLFTPHVSPEAFHWEKAERMIAAMGMNIWQIDFSFWSNLNWVGDMFWDNSRGEKLVSFNLVDTVMSLVKEREMIKYLYHHQEALWNKIIIEHFGEHRVEEVASNNLINGWFDITQIIK